MNPAQLNKFGVCVVRQMCERILGGATSNIGCGGAITASSDIIYMRRPREIWECLAGLVVGGPRVVVSRDFYIYYICSAHTATRGGWRYRCISGGSVYPFYWGGGSSAAYRIQ